MSTEPNTATSKLAQLRAKLTNKKLAILAVAVILAGLGWRYQQAASAEPELEFVAPVVQDIQKTLSVSGVVDAKRKARLRFLSGGKLTYLSAQQGDWVKAQQTIARIDERLLQKQLERELNTYLQQRWDWETTLDTTRDESLDEIERREVEKQQFALNKSVIAVQMQDIGISDTRLVAPFAGILTSAPTNYAGVQLAPSDYFELVDPDSLIFIVGVDELDISLVQTGQPATITIDAFRDNPLELTVETIAFASQQTSSGTVFAVEFKIPNQTHAFGTLRIGMNGEAALLLDEKKQVLTIPLNATRTRDGVVYVDVLTQNSEYEQRAITIGIQTNRLVEVTGGLSPDDRVLLPN